MASARSDDARCSQKISARQNSPPCRRILAIRSRVTARVPRFQCATLNVPQNSRPNLYPLPHGQSIGVRRAFLRTRKNVQPAQDHFRPATPKPPRQFERALCEGQMHRDSNHLRKRFNWRQSLQQVLIPIAHFPIFWRRPRNTRQRQRRRQHMLPKAGVRIFRIKWINQKREIFRRQRSFDIWKFWNGDEFSR